MKKPKNYYGFAWSKGMKKKRKKKLQKFYKKNCFDPSETWNLDHTIAQFILPRLKYFRENLNSYPGADGWTIEKWEKKLDRMIIAFEMKIEDDMDYTEKDWKKIDRGLALFAKHFHNLWD